MVSANDTGGDHQHEVSEKRPAPDIFTTRIDLELCACGARRWVDQDGTPATPWRFINLGTSPIRKEDARVAPRTSPKSALEGLITCGNCGKPMLRDGTQHDKEAHYVCQPGPGNRWAQCQTPRLHARSAEVLLIGKVLQTVLTEENISRVLPLLNDPQRYDAAHEHSLTRRDVQEIREIPERFVLAAGWHSKDQTLPRQNHHRDTGPRRKSGRPLLHPSAGGQSPGGQAPAGNRPAGGSTSLMDNHGNLTAAYGHSWEASPILAETPGAWVTLSHRSS